MTRSRVVGPAALAVLVLASRWVLLGEARDGVLWTVDELEMTLTAADRFLGVPHTATHWSGALLQILLEPVLLARYLATATDISLTGFVQWLSTVYRSPWDMVWTARAIVALGFSAGLAALAIPLRERGGAWFAAAVVLGVASIPELWVASVQATPGGLAIGVLCVAIAIALAGSGETMAAAIAAGVCMGLAVAARTVVGPAAFFVLAAVIARARRPLAAGLAMIAASVAGFAAACPYVWIEPVRFAKATLGAIVKSGTAVGVLSSLAAFAQVVPWWLLLAMVCAAVVAVRDRTWVLLGGAVTSVAVMILAAARTPDLGTRYYVAMPVVGAAFAATILGPALVSWIACRGRLVRGAAAIACAAIVIGHAASVIQTRRAMIDSQRHTAIVARYLAETSATGSRVAVPEALEPYVIANASRDAIARMTTAQDRALQSGAVGAVLEEQYAMAPDVLRALAGDFDENERASRARLALMGLTAPEGGLDLVVHSEPRRARRAGHASTADAIAAFGHGELDTLVLERTPLEDVLPVFASGPFFVYRAASTPSTPAGPGGR